MKTSNTSNKTHRIAGDRISLKPPLSNYSYNERLCCASLTFVQKNSQKRYLNSENVPAGTNSFSPAPRQSSPLNLFQPIVVAYVSLSWKFHNGFFQCYVETVEIFQIPYREFLISLHLPPTDYASSNLWCNKIKSVMWKFQFRDSRKAVAFSKKISSDSSGTLAQGGREKHKFKKKRTLRFLIFLGNAVSEPGLSVCLRSSFFTTSFSCLWVDAVVTFAVMTGF